MPQEVQSRIKENLQQQLQEVEQRRNDLWPEHQKGSKDTEHPGCQRQVGTKKAFQRVLLNLILHGFGVQMVKAKEQESSVHQMIDKDLCPILHAESGVRWMWMEACEVGEWSLEDRASSARIRKEKQRDPSTPVRKSQEKDPRTFEEKQPGKRQALFKGRSHRAEKWRVQGKWKKEK